MIINNEEAQEQLKSVFDNSLGLHIIKDRYIAKEVISPEDIEKFFSVIELAYLSVYNKNKNKSKISYQDFLQNLKNEYFEQNTKSSSIIVYDTLLKKTVATMRLIHRGKTFLEEMHSNFNLQTLRNKGLKVGEVGRFTNISSGSQAAGVYILLINLLMTMILRESLDLVFIGSINRAGNLVSKFGFRKLEGPYYDHAFGLMVDMGWEKTLSLLKYYSKIDALKRSNPVSIHQILMILKSKLRYFFSGINFNKLESYIKTHDQFNIESKAEMNDG